MEDTYTRNMVDFKYYTKCKVHYHLRTSTSYIFSLKGKDCYRYYNFVYIYISK